MSITVSVNQGLMFKEVVMGGSAENPDDEKAKKEERSVTICSRSGDG
jgi:hypothetical protein